MLVVLAGVLAAGAALALYLGLERAGPAGVPLALLRAVAWGAVAALLIDPGCRRAGVGAPPVVLLDESLSMTDPGDLAGAGGARWRAAVDTALAAAGRAGRVIGFGARPAAFGGAARPDAPASRLLPAWREAAALGGPITVVTDGELDDAADLPPDLRLARVVVLPRPSRADVGVAGLDLPATLRAGDTATAAVMLVASGTSPSDTATVELLEGSGSGARVAARSRVPLGGGGSLRRELRFVPAAPPPGADRELRRYQARATGVTDDAEPRDDARATVALVTRSGSVVAITDSPDWDFRALTAALAQTAGVPVTALVRIAAGRDAPWRDAAGLRPVALDAVTAAVRGAALVVVHGTVPGTAALAAEARHGLWRWTGSGGGGGGAAAVPGDWYVTPSPAASPVGAALAGVPVESLPPLEAVAEQPPPDSAPWTAVEARLARRGRAWPAVAGAERGGRRVVRMLGSGFWRWPAQGGVAAEAWRSLVAAITDWLMTEPDGEGGAAAVAARRDSLARGQGLDEFLPRPRTLASQPGVPAGAAVVREPLRQSAWPYALALGALVLEWIARRRRGMR